MIVLLAWVEAGQARGQNISQARVKLNQYEGSDFMSRVFVHASGVDVFRGTRENTGVMTLMHQLLMKWRLGTAAWNRRLCGA